MASSDVSTQLKKAGVRLAFVLNMAPAGINNQAPLRNLSAEIVVKDETEKIGGDGDRVHASPALADPAGTVWRRPSL